MHYIVAFDNKRGIGKDNTIPWKIIDDITYFKEKTMFTNVIMGYNTYISLPEQYRPLPNRFNIVITTKYITSKENDNVVFCNIDEINKHLKFKDTYVIGGQKIYEQLINKCTKIYTTQIDKDFKCNIFFPEITNDFYVSDYSEIFFCKNEECSYRFICYTRKSIESDEKQYIKHVKYILDNGINKMDRTNVGTISCFGTRLEFDISDNIPILTSKKIAWRACIKELLWFLKGETNANILKEQGVKIWNGNSTREFLDSVGLYHLNEGDCGASYGFQWRHFGADYIDCNTDYKKQGFDQVNYVLNLLKTDPNSRRIIISGWNPCDLKKTVLPCCHISAQWIVEDGKISCMMTQRSQDVFLGAPFNILSYAVLTYIFALKCDLIPHRLIINIGDTHIYTNHIEQVKRQITRPLYARAKLHIDKSVKDKNFDNISINDFDIIGYIHHSPIKGDMAI